MLELIDELVSGVATTGGGGSSFDTITAVNKTGSAVSAGDKVYINKVGADYVLTDLYTKTGGQKVLNPELKSSSATLPTISSEFEVTNFTNSNNLGGTFTIPSINYGNFTLYMKAKMPSTTSGTQSLLSGHLDLRYHCGSQKLQTYDDGLKDLISSVSRNTVYYIKLNVNGTTRTFSISSDNVNWTSASITSTSLADKTAINMYYGYSPYTSNIYLSSGSLYLEDIYIKDETSGQVLWRAVEEHISSQITPNTITGFATQNIADNASGSVKTVL